MSDMMAMDMTGDTELIHLFEQLGAVDVTAPFKQAMHEGAALVAKQAQDNLDTMIYANPAPEAERKRAEGLHGKTVPLENYKVTPSLAITTVATLAFYAPFVHFGTGIAGTAKGGRDEPWVYRDADGEFHTTVGQEPKPYMTQALAQRKQEYMKLLYIAIMTVPKQH